jgi:hypothetical protein
MCLAELEVAITLIVAGAKRAIKKEGTKPHSNSGGGGVSDGGGGGGGGGGWGDDGMADDGAGAALSDDDYCVITREWTFAELDALRAKCAPDARCYQ